MNHYSEALVDGTVAANGSRMIAVEVEAKLEEGNIQAVEFALRETDSVDIAKRLSREIVSIIFFRKLTTHKIAMVLFNVYSIATAPFDGQKLGTPGLRNMVTIFMQPNYLHNLVQVTFNALTVTKIRGGTLVVTGDHCYYSMVAIDI